MPGRIAVVDESNRFVRWASRAAIHAERLVHRSVHVVIFDSAGRLLVQQRHAAKQTYPGYWDVSVAGHVEESDYPGAPDAGLDAVYAAVAAREVHEELGIAPPLQRLGTFGPVADVHYEQIQLFRGVSDGPYVLQPDEVAAYRLVARADVTAFLASGAPVTPVLRLWLGLPEIWT